jgi:hypothetical protein
MADRKPIMVDDGILHSMSSGCELTSKRQLMPVDLGKISKMGGLVLVL